MASSPGPLVIGFPLPEAGRAAAAQALAGAAEIVHLPDLEPAARADALRRAGVVLVRNTSELKPEERGLIGGARLLQIFTAGVDFVRFEGLPPDLPIACNKGAFAEPMAEHAAAMALAAAKRLLVEHQALRAGQFNQFTPPTRMLAGGVCGILGYGGIGVATARVMRGLGMKIHAVNRRGVADEPLDWIGTTAETDRLLAASDVLVIAVPLTRATEKMIDAAALGRMKPDAILINLARGEIVDEAALYAHLKANPGFTACIDAWWVEPVRHGAFRMDQPFLDLPNTIGSPHNSASVAGWREVALSRAVENCRRALLGQPVQHLVGGDERLA